MYMPKSHKARPLFVAVYGSSFLMGLFWLMIRQPSVVSVISLFLLVLLFSLVLVWHRQRMSLVRGLVFFLLGNGVVTAFYLWPGVVGSCSVLASSPVLRLALGFLSVGVKVVMGLFF